MTSAYDDDRCTYSDLHVDTCAHCAGDVLTDAEPTPVAPETATGVVVWSPTKARQDARDAISRPRSPRTDPNATRITPGAQGGPECRCGRPVHDNAVACDTCADSLSRALGDVPWLDEELDTTITKQRAAATEGGPRSASSGLPWHEKAADAKRTLHATLVTWVRLCHEERVRHQSHLAGLPDDNLPSLSRWLMWRVDGLARHEAGADAIDEITDAVATCHRLIDRRPDLEFVGPCECGRDLYRRPAAKVVACRSCGNTYDVDALLEWMNAQVMGRYVTAREGAGLLSKFGLSTAQGTIDKWHGRKLIVGHGNDQRGRRLYLFDDLVTLAAKNANKGA